MSEPETIDDSVEQDPAETESDGAWLREQLRLIDLEEGFAA
jgi:hypothetical protein